MSGWQDYVIASAADAPMGLSKIPPGVVPTMPLSVLGVTGLTAYWGLLDIGAPKAGYAMVMFPVVALVFSVLFEGMAIEVTTVIGTLFVLAGNWLVLKSRESDTPARSVGCPEMAPAK